MAFDPLSLVLTTVGEFLAKKALSVAWDCVTCRQPDQSRIENVAYNQFYCSNCRTERLQFTNACAATVAPNGRISHIGVRYGNFEHLRDRTGIVGDLFGWKCTDIRAPVHYLCQGFAGQDLVETNIITDFKTGQFIWDDVSKFDAESNQYIAKRWLILPRQKISNDLFESLFDNDAILVFDTKIQNAYGDLLFTDRKLHQL